jgi:hypothetical protein
MRPGDHLPQAMSRGKRLLDIQWMSNNLFRFTANVHIIGPPLNSQRKENLLPLLPHQEFMVSRFRLAFSIGFD